MPGGETSHVHVVALPYPGRGHINPMMNLCKLLVSKCPNLTISFIITEEWHGFIGSTPKPPSITFQTIPNVIPSELIRASIFPQFVRDVNTKMGGPVEKLLDNKVVVPPVAAIIADTAVPWAVELGNKRNIPVVSLWTMSPSVFSTFYHFDLLLANGHFPTDISEPGDEIIDYIPGVTPTRLADLTSIFSGFGNQVLEDVLFAISESKKAKALMFTSFYELEHQVIDVLKATLPYPVSCLGPLIPHKTLSSTPSEGNVVNYWKWLNSQPIGSVMYISLGSYLSVSKEQMEEIVEGVRESGVRYLWVAREDSSKVQEACGPMGLVVPWCDQLKVLCHDSVGGFWTHCGWNSTLEGIFAGVPMLTFPIFSDQILNSKAIADDWKVGRRVKEVGATKDFVGRKEISRIIQRFMDLDGDEESKKMRRNASKFKETCRCALLPNGGSSEANLDAFVQEFLTCHSSST